MRKVIAALVALLILIVVLIPTGCKQAESWDPARFDTTLPTLGQDGWYLVFEDNFDGSRLNENIVFGEQFSGNRQIWTTSPHAIRWESQNKNKPEQASYWCPDMVRVENGNVVITARYDDNHQCSQGVCPANARFTGGIETRAVVGDPNDNKGTNDDLLFAQAFGYFETRVKFPNAKGLWSAFWLQSSNMRKTGAEGVDGTEIDIYESAFIRHKTKMGHALLWNGYGEYGKVSDYIVDTETDLYDGYHTFALKWTPLYYVFYIDGVATWATDAGGVSHVKEFLRLTVEIDAGDRYGPHGQKIGAFDDQSVSEFYVDYVKVWQNSNYESYIIDDDCFAGDIDLQN